MGRCGPHEQRHCTHHHKRHDERVPHMPSTAREEATSVTDTDITQRWGCGGPLAFHVQRILGEWVGFAYLKIAVKGRKGVGVPGELRGPSSGRSSPCIEWSWVGGESLAWVVAFEEVDLQKWEIYVRGLKGRSFLRIWEILMGNNVCFRELGPGVGFL